MVNIFIYDFRLKSVIAVHGNQCALYISKLLLLPFFVNFNLSLFLQRVNSCQYNLSSWTQLQKQRYVDVLR